MADPPIGLTSVWQLTRLNILTTLSVDCWGGEVTAACHPSHTPSPLHLLSPLPSPRRVLCVRIFLSVTVVNTDSPGVSWLARNIEVTVWQSCPQYTSYPLLSRLLIQVFTSERADQPDEWGTSQAHTSLGFSSGGHDLAVRVSAFFIITFCLLTLPSQD